MFRFLTTLLFFLMFVFVGAGSLQAADGKSLFKENKCTKCHTFKSAGFLKVVKEAADEEDEEAEDEEDEDPPDLSKLSDKVLQDKSGLTPEEHIKKYLKKQVRHGTKKHKKLFKGSDGELDVLVKFILKTSGK